MLMNSDKGKEEEDDEQEQATGAANDYDSPVIAELGEGDRAQIEAYMQFAMTEEDRARLPEVLRAARDREMVIPNLWASEVGEMLAHFVLYQRSHEMAVGE